MTIDEIGKFIRKYNRKVFINEMLWKRPYKVVTLVGREVKIVSGRWGVNVKEEVQTIDHNTYSGAVLTFKECVDKIKSTHTLYR